jgi:2-succinyl-6-hydroxy-2,4-cyclohexadiene-1-carboxylate synthase
MAVDRRTSFVLLHGFSGSPASWQAVSAGLPTAAEIFCPAIVGHASDTGPAVDFVTEVDRLAKAIAARGVSGAHICGYSLGARVALGLLIRHPGLFARATLVGANPGLPEDSPERAERMAADERWARLAETEGAARFFDGWSAQSLFASQRALPDSVRAQQDAIRASHDGIALAGAMRGLSLARMPDWRPQLGRIAIPVTAMAGALDHKFVALSRQLVQSLPNARIEIVPQAGHNIPLERPSAIIAALLAGD